MIFGAHNCVILRIRRASIIDKIDSLDSYLAAQTLHVSYFGPDKVLHVAYHSVEQQPGDYLTLSSETKTRRGVERRLLNVAFTDVMLPPADNQLSTTDFSPHAGQLLSESVSIFLPQHGSE